MRKELLRRAMKYLLLFILLVIVFYYIPLPLTNESMSTNDILLISMVGTIIYAIVDMFLPSIYFHKNEKNDNE